MRETLEDFYNHSLDIISPWEIVEIKRDSKTRKETAIEVVPQPTIRLFKNHNTQYIAAINGYYLKNNTVFFGENL